MMADPQRSDSHDETTSQMMELNNMVSRSSQGEEEGEIWSDTEKEESVQSMPYISRVLSKNIKMASPPISPEPKQDLIVKQDKHAEHHAEFMRAIINKDMVKVTEDLARDPILYCYTDEKGVTTIEQAVKSGSVDMLQVFLNKAQELKKAILVEHALLYAIQENQIKIVEFLLDVNDTLLENMKEVTIHPETLNQDQSTKERKMKKHISNIHKLKNNPDFSIPGFENSGYSPFITPIILAAKLNRLEIISLLLKRDASEIHPLTKKCPLDGECEICQARELFQSRRDLEDSKRLLMIYRALSSPAYIFLSGVTDPILEAFELSGEMTKMSEEDPAFRLQYGEIAKSCQTFAWEMLDLCRTTKEVDRFLTHDESANQLNIECGNTSFPRIIVAIHFKQKEFVAHPYCQQALDKSWYSGLPDWVCKSRRLNFMLLIYVLMWILIWPVASLFSMLRVTPKCLPHMKYPINKFITDTLSFLTFIALLALHENEGKHMTAGSYSSMIETLLIMWIIGMSARHIKLLWNYRKMLKHVQTHIFMSSLLWYDTFFLLAFWLCIITRVIGIILAYTVWQPDELRSEWHWAHPIFISEAFFVFGTILAFVRLTDLFKASSTLGPLQISLTKMLTDIARFLVIYLVIMTGFVVAINKVYSNYENSRRIVAGDYRQQGEGYMGFQQTYITLFWNVFSYGDLYGDAEIVVDFNETEAITNLLSMNSSNPPKIPNHNFTEGVGYFLIGAYHVVAVVVLLNMLIAMMANSYNTIQQNSDLEWKFARTILRTTYYSAVWYVPPPFNILIVGTVIRGVVNWCAKCSTCCNSLHREQKQENDNMNTSSLEHLMGKLFKRYWNKKKEEENGKDFSCIYDNLAQLNTNHSTEA